MDNNIMGISSLMVDNLNEKDIAEKIEKGIINGESTGNENYQGDNYFSSSVSVDYDKELEEVLNDNINENVSDNDEYNNDHNNDHNNYHNNEFFERKDNIEDYVNHNNKESLYNSTINNSDNEEYEYVNTVAKKIYGKNNDQEYMLDDDKYIILEQIDTLRQSLEDDDVNITSVPIVDKDSSIEDIKHSHRLLLQKNDRNRYCSFAEELILAGAKGLEFMFDGEKEWFGKKPDLVGWSNTVQMKLRRSRIQTATFVKDVMGHYKFSSGVRLMLEILPSMFLHTRTGKLSKNYIKENKEQEYKKAFNNLDNI